MASQEIETLAAALARLPGLGPRSARRAVLWLVKRRESALPALLEALATVGEALVECDTCGNVDTTNPCGICADPRRDHKALCVVEDVADLWALDRAKLFTGKYHVLGGKLSALDGVRPEDLNIASLMARVEEGGVDARLIKLAKMLDAKICTTDFNDNSSIRQYECRIKITSHVLSSHPNSIVIFTYNQLVVKN